MTVTKWVCWQRHRFYSGKHNGCVRAEGDRSHAECGWFEITPHQEQP